MPIPSGSYTLSGTVGVGIWRKVSGVWGLFTTEYVYIYQVVAGSGVRTVGWGLYGTYALGSGVTDFGVTIESQDGTAAALTNLDISYNTVTTTGTRSASPNGEMARSTVRP